MTQWKDSDVIASVLRGDINAFTRLCDKYYRVLVALAYAIVGDHHLAEDAAQETFTRALTGLRSLRNPDRFGVWLGKICRHVARDMIQQRRKASHLSEAVVYKKDENPLACERQSVTRALSRLNEKDRQVIVMRYYHQDSYDHMAEVLNTSKAAINGRLTRAKKKLATILSANGWREVTP